MNARNPVGATQTTFALVEALADEGPLGVTALATRADVTKGTVHNHLSTLRQLGYVKKAGDRYALTLRFLAIGERTRANIPLFRVAKPNLDNLAMTAQECASLHVETDGMGTCVYLMSEGDGTGDGRVAGERAPLHTTAPGKAILAHLPTDRVEDIVDQHGLAATTDATITDRETLRRQLRQIRDDGVAFSTGEWRDGVNEVAAPVRTADGVEGAIAVSGPEDVLTGRHFREDITGQVVSTAKRVEVELRSVVDE